MRGRRLIRQIRRVYHGPLTYAANWSGEYKQIRFWDALDYVGIQAYFPLRHGRQPFARHAAARLAAAFVEDGPVAEKLKSQ